MIQQSFPSAKSVWRRLWLSLCLLVCLCSGTVSAQDTSDEDVVKVRSNLVLLNVGVADRRGQPITDLRREDFVVLEDGVRQRIESFEPTSAPFSLVLLLDMSGSTLNFRQSLKQSALRFIDALAPEDRISIVSFRAQRKKSGEKEDRIETLAQFTSDRRKIAAAISYAEGSGDTNLYQALKFSLGLLAKEGQRRKAIVVLTDGLDTDVRKLDSLASADARTDTEAISSVKPEETSVLRNVLDAADRQGVTIYPLALPSGDLKRLAFPTPQQTAIYAGARARLEALANRTGGRLHQINRLEDMGRLYAEVAAEMRTLYSIAYQSTSPSTRSGNWRAIQIQVTRADAVARTRPGYYTR